MKYVAEEDYPRDEHGCSHCDAVVDCRLAEVLGDSGMYATQAVRAAKLILNEDNKRGIPISYLDDPDMAVAGINCELRQARAEQIADKIGALWQSFELNG